MRKPARYIEPMLYRPEEVARLIGFGRSSVYDLIRAGEIPSVLVAGRIRVRRESLEAWIEASSRSKRQN
jgi:excisionase family DNA binding protein